MDNRNLRYCGKVFAAVGLLVLAGNVAAADSSKVDTSSLREDERYDRFIVKYRSGSQEQAGPAAVKASLDNTQGLTAEVAHVRTLAVGAELIVSQHILDRAEAEALMHQIASNPDVETIEPDALMYPTGMPNDPRYGEQWGYYDADAGIRASEAWGLANGAGAVVAVLDTGITTHSDLDANILPGYDFITELPRAGDGDGRDANARDEGDWQCGARSSWHGTHVIGTIAAVTNNGVGVAGVAHGAKVIPIRVLGRCGGRVSDISEAIIWAAGGDVPGVPSNPHPAEVINMSLSGLGACGVAFQSAIDAATDRGTTVVVAAGNDNRDAFQATPANCNNVIAVGANASSGARAGFSNFGAGVDIAAPGVNVLSTLNDGSTIPAGESYASYQGTSMAAPHVAGVVALMQAHAPNPQTPSQIEALLKSTARPFPVTLDHPLGAGIVDARRAVEAVATSPAPPPPPTPGSGNAWMTVVLDYLLE